MVTDLNSSADAEVSKCTYSRSGNSLSIQFDTAGTTGDSFTLAASVATPAAATLEGGSHVIALRNTDGTVVGPYAVEPGATTTEAVPQESLGITPYTGGAAERTHYAFGTSDTWSLSARVLSIKPRGDQVEITAVGEYDDVHQN